MPGFNFTCGVDGCPQTYSGIMSYLRRRHRCTDCNHPHISPPGIQSDVHSNQAVSETSDAHPSIDTIDAVEQVSATSEHHLEVDKLKRSAALFLLSLKERYQIIQTALDFAVGQVQQMV